MKDVLGHDSFITNGRTILPCLQSIVFVLESVSTSLASARSINGALNIPVHPAEDVAVLCKSWPNTFAGSSASWWRNLSSETRLGPRCYCLKLLSNMTYLLERLISVYSRALALDFGKIKQVGYSSSVSTKISQNWQFVPPTEYLFNVITIRRLHASNIIFKYRVAVLRRWISGR